MGAEDSLVLEAWRTAHAPPGGSGWYRAACPFCPSVLGKPDRRQSFAIESGTGRYKCYRCQTRGRVRSLPDWVLGQSAPVANVVHEIEPPEDWTPLWKGDGLEAMVFDRAREYLLNRGFDRKLWREASIGACAEGYFGGRVVVPVRDEEGGWIGYAGRTWGRQEPKYLYPKGMARGSMLYEQHLLYEKSKKPVMIVEGIFDALPYFGRAVACLGKPGHLHVEMISKAKRPVAVVLDGDAWEEAYSLAMRLRLRGLRAGYVRLPPKRDPNTVDREWLIKKVEECIDDKKSVSTDR